MSRRVRIPVPASAGISEVPGWLDGPASAATLLVLAPGAGAPADSAFMTALAVETACADVRVLRFDFPYQERARREGTRKPPDRAAVLLATWAAVLRYVRRRLRPRRVVIGGKSMGGRYATLLLAGAPVEPLPCVVAAAVLVGYPLHPPGKPDRMRTEHLRDVGVPMLFLAGTRDSLAGIDALRMVTASLRGASLHEVDDADHDFKVPKRTGRTRAEVIEELAATIRSYLGGTPSP